jgi:hypothetical protein
MDMISKNNWITENIQERLTNQNSDFVAQLIPYPFTPISFDQAVEQTVHEISQKYKNLYLGLSGGYDSDFVMQAFHKHNVPITPVIVLCGNELESSYAFETCKKLNIQPVVITISDDEFVNYYEEKIYKKFNGVGIRSTYKLFASEYVQKNNGTFVTGENWLGDGSDIINNQKVSFINEWDFYHIHNYDIPCIDFFLYSAELSYSMIPHHLPKISWSQYKNYLFKIEYRKKMKLEYSEIIKHHIFRMRSIKMCPVNTSVSWSKDKIDQIFNCVLLNK